MARPRFSKLDEAEQHRILKASAEEFTAKGFDGTSLNRLIDRLGISKGSFYYYFDDKADLFSTVANHAWELFLPGAEVDLSIFTEMNYWAVLSEYMRETRARVREHPWLVGFTRMIYNPPAVPEIERSMAERFAEARELQGALIRRGQELGTVRDDLPVDLMLALLTGADEAADRWFVDHWEHESEDENERLFEEVFAIFKRMMEPPSEPTRRSTRS
jgi:AcrR family transcriptional regulator